MIIRELGSLQTTITKLPAPGGVVPPSPTSDTSFGVDNSIWVIGGVGVASLAAAYFIFRKKKS